MSQELGGRSDKFGNEFERLWVVSLVLRILDGQATSLRWEPLGAEGDGIELRLTLPDGDIEVHQCKIENKYHGNWTIRALEKAGVIGAMWRQLNHRDADRFVFVSRDPCRVFSDLCNRAAHCNDDPHSFLSDSLSSGKHRDEFRDLCHSWNLDNNQPDDIRAALGYLRRIGFERGFWERGERLLIERHARWFAKGDGKSIVDSLVRFLSESLGNEVSATELRAHLRSDGYPPWDLLNDRSAAAAIERLQNQFCESLTDVLADNRLIPRSETDEIWNLLSDENGPRLLLVHGRAGHGKSGVLLELANRLRDETVPFLPIRLDSQRPEGGHAFVRDVLGLPGPPAKCLSATAGKKPAVLIIDQLDAVRWTAAHSETAWQICREIIDLALACDTLRVVVACRTFDLQDDHRFKGWEADLAARGGSRPMSKRVEVSLLRTEDVKQFVARHGEQFEQLTNRQQELLRIPLALYLWWTLRTENLLPDTFSTASDLMGVFWHSRRQKLTAERGISDAQLSECLDKAVDYLDRNGRQDFPASLAAPYPNVLAAAKSLNLIQSPSRGVLKFAHQSYLDYLIAERVMRECTAAGHSPLEWIRSREQSLFRREQLRQLLLLLREETPDEYLTLLQRLFWDDDIRFHLRQLGLSILRDVETPTDGEYRVLNRLLGDESWRQHALRLVVLGHSGWFGRCATEGLFRDWFASDDEEMINDAIWMLRVAPESLRHLVDAALAPYASSGDPKWATRIDATLPLDTCDDSEVAFEWRRNRVRTGHVRAEIYALAAAAKTRPDRAIQLLEALFDHYVKTFEDQFRCAEEKDTPRLEAIRGEPIAEICRNMRRAGQVEWKLLLTILERSVALSRRVRKKRIRQSKEQDSTALFLPADSLWRLNRRVQELNGAARRILTRIGRKLIRAEFQYVWDELSALDLKHSRFLNRFACGVLKAAPTDKANDVILWLLEDHRRFAIGSQLGEVPQKPACSLIARFAVHCDDDVFRSLEAAALRYHGPEEKWSVEQQLRVLKEEGLLWPNYYGRGQYLLLAAMPQNRMSAQARSALMTWRSKFGDPTRWERDTHAKVEFRGSSIPHDRKHLVTDANWLRIISTGWASKPKRRRPDRDFAERSHEMFARDLGDQAKLNPTRIVRLAMRIPLDAPINYFEWILRGLDQREDTKNHPDGMPEWEPARFEEIQALIERLLDGAVNSAELTEAICWLVRNRSHERWSLRIMDYIADACVNAPSPLGKPQTGPENSLRVWEGTRGVAVEALQQLVSSHAGLEVRYIPEIRQISADPHAGVRAEAGGLCISLLRRNPEWAVQLFLNVCDHDDDRVLSGLYVAHFLKYVWHRYATKVEPLLCRMIASRNDDAAELGAYWATGGYLAKGLYSTPAVACRTGTISQRKGVASAVVDLTKTEEWQKAAVTELPTLFDDVDDVVSDAAAHVFRENSDLLRGPLGLVAAEAFVESKAFERDPSDLVLPLRDLRGSLLAYGPTILRIVDRASGPMASQIADIRTRYALVSRAIPELLLRLYQEAEGTEHSDLRSSSLDAWDMLLKSQIVSQEELKRIDW